MSAYYHRLLFAPGSPLPGGSQPPPRQSTDTERAVSLVAPGDILALAVHLPGILEQKMGNHFRPGENVTVNEDFSICAAGYGIPYLVGENIVQLQIPFRVAPDRMEAFLFLGRTLGGFLPDINFLKEFVERNGIRFPVSDDELLAAFARAGGEPRGWIRIARGIRPTDGLAIGSRLLLTEKEPAPVASGRVDFREREFVKSVKKGQPVLEVLPAAAATDGFNIYGEPVAGQTIAREYFAPGENLVASGENPQIYNSDLTGCISFYKGQVNVRELLVIEQDVDLTTGNIRYHGSVQIAGSIRAGMIVEAQGDIFVAGTIEPAAIRARGSVFAGGGIFGKPDLKIRSGATVAAEFFQNANICAEGDVLVRNSITNSIVYAGDSVFVGPDPGRIISGIVVSACSIEATEAGNPSGSFTFLRAGLGADLTRRVEKNRTAQSSLVRMRQKIIQSIQVLAAIRDLRELKAVIGGLDPIRRSKINELIGKLRGCEEKIRVLASTAARYETMARQRRRPYIKIGTRLWSGVKVLLDDRPIEILDAREACTFH